MEELASLSYRSNKKRQVLFQINESVVEKLDELGRAFGIGRSELIRHSIMQFLEKELPIANKMLKQNTLNRYQQQTTPEY